MKEYKVDGLIYYHYYFEGKKLLEQPAENLLKNKNIEQRFFFCWANHSWNRSWNGTKELLLEQTYGNEKAWENHFQYLLPFFKDKRYEKKNNKPLFMFFRPDFKEKNAIINYFDKRCIDEGFSGIYPIESCYAISGKEYERFKSELNSKSIVHYRQPWLGENLTWRDEQNTLVSRIRQRITRYGLCGFIWPIGCSKCLKASMRYIPDFDNSIPGIFFEWDNTPRHGKRGYIIAPLRHNVFIKYMNYYKNSEYIFVNAWNEWCEGMVLEPTEKDGYKYLEWIKEWREANHV